MEEFLKQNASAVFALVGALGGGLLAFLARWALSKRDYTLRLWERLIERRITAHENVITMALEMRVMVAMGGIEEDGEFARTPRILLSKEDFEFWFTKFTQFTQQRSTWLTTEARREVNLAQDYLVTLHTNLAGAATEKYPRIGQIIRQDFINFSSRLEEKTFKFFEKEVHQLKMSNLKDWHKYERPETEKRLNETVLLTEWKRIERIVKAASPQS